MAIGKFPSNNYSETIVSAIQTIKTITYYWLSLILHTSSYIMNSCLYYCLETSLGKHPFVSLPLKPIVQSTQPKYYTIHMCPRLCPRKWPHVAQLLAHLLAQLLSRIVSQLELPLCACANQDCPIAMSALYTAWKLHACMRKHNCGCMIIPPDLVYKGVSIIYNINWTLWYIFII